MTHAMKLLGSLLLPLPMLLATNGCQPSQPKPDEAQAESAADADSAAADETPDKEEMPSDAETPELNAASPDETGDNSAPPEPDTDKSDSDTADDKTAADSGEKGGKVMLGSPELTAGIPGEGKLTTEQIQKWLDDPRNHEELDFELPMGLDAGVAQIEMNGNPLTRAKIELGRQLYFDSRLSADTSTACASCHDPDEGYAKHTQFGVGLRGQLGGRNSPVSYNRILSTLQFWDGRAPTLEEQAVGPIANPIEMGNTHDACIECLKGVEGYKMQFDKIFGKLDIESVAQAIASFERVIVTGPTPFDYNEKLQPFARLDPEDIKADEETNAMYEQALADAEAHPMSESAKRGRELFFTDKANCTACHVGANLTDEKFHNIGVGMDKEKPDIGREEFTKNPQDRGAFKTPTIRNVALSAPYMHDGSVKTLEEVVEWYAKGGHPNDALSDKIKKLDLSDQDKADLVEFMKACTGDFPKVTRDRLPE